MLTQGSEAGGVAGDPSRSPAGRTYQVRTYGCQMNVHDSERLAGLLEAAGYRRAADGEDADVVVFNTCAVRENADNKLYGNISHLAPRKQADPEMQIAVGGCLAQKDREGLLKKAPWVDVVFGTHTSGRCLRCSSGPGTTAKLRSRSPSRCGNSPRPCLQRANLLIAAWVSHLGRLQQHLHLLHRARAARQGGRPPPRRHPGRGALAGRPGRARSDPARPERQRLRGVVCRPRHPARPRRVRVAAAQLR